MKIKLQKVYITWFIFEPSSIHIHILLFNQFRVNNIITSIAAALCQFQFVKPCSLEAVESRTKWAAGAVRSSLRGMVGCWGSGNSLFTPPAIDHRGGLSTFDSQISDYGLKWKEPFDFLASAQSWPINQPKPRLTLHLCCQLLLFSYFMFLWFLPAPPLVSQFSTGRAADILCGIVALWGVKCARHSGISCWQERIRLPAGLRSFLLILAAFSSNMCPTNVAPVPPKEETTAHPHQQPGCLLLLHF